jgi:hypothetical protein
MWWTRTPTRPPFLGLVSASLTAVLLLAYAVTLLLGFAAIDPPGTPIPDPFFTILELLILVLAPVLLLLTRSSPRARPMDGASSDSPHWYSWACRPLSPRSCISPS